MSMHPIPASTPLSWSVGTRLVLALVACLPLWAAMAWALGGQVSP